MSQKIDVKPLFILAAALEAGCAELTVRRSVQMQKIKGELEIINGKPTWVLDRQSFDAWAAKRKARTANVVGGEATMEAEAAHE